MTSAASPTEHPSPSSPRAPIGRSAARIAVVAALLFGGGPLVANFELVPPLVGFALFALSAPLALIALIAGITQLVRRGRAPRAVMAVVLSLVPLLMVGALVLTRPEVPPINDVTTDLDDPPRFVRAAERPGLEDADLSFPDAFREPIAASYGDLATLHVGAPIATVLSASLAVAAELGWEDVTSAIGGEGIVVVEGVAVSGMFHFRDDVVVRLRSVAPGETEVDVRSRSRVGRSDLGANAARIRRFLAALSERLER